MLSLFKFIGDTLSLLLIKILHHFFCVGVLRDAWSILVFLCTTIDMVIYTHYSSKLKWVFYTSLVKSAKSPDDHENSYIDQLELLAERNNLIYRGESQSMLSQLRILNFGPSLKLIQLTSCLMSGVHSPKQTLGICAVASASKYWRRVWKHMLWISYFDIHINFCY